MTHDESKQIFLRFIEKEIYAWVNDQEQEQDEIRISVNALRMLKDSFTDIHMHDDERLVKVDIDTSALVEKRCNERMDRFADRINQPETFLVSLSKKNTQLEKINTSTEPFKQEPKHCDGCGKELTRAFVTDADGKLYCSNKCFDCECLECEDCPLEGTC